MTLPRRKLYRARELKFEGSLENMLNYNIRALGRRGVPVLNAVAGKSQLAVVEREMPKFLPMLAFNEGRRYSDFIPGTDTVAAYGIGALVNGKLGGWGARTTAAGRCAQRVVCKRCWTGPLALLFQDSSLERTEVKSTSPCATSPIGNLPPPP